MSAAGSEGVIVHATTVAIDRAAVVIRGAPGSGKSDLALRLIDAGARLVADDRTRLDRRDGALVASAPPAIAGLFEVRGLGVVEMPRDEWAEVVLLVDLVRPEEVERIPESAAETLLGVPIPRLALAAFEASAAAKLRLAVAQLRQGIMAPR
jgi:serine kinase of HPr protein (carbohydrate metabolism regulator)